jgi:[ribosomal protein S18]-alanine N-acetyltransferase
MAAGMNDLEIRIRTAVRSDLAAFVELEQACFAVPWSEESLRHDLEDHPEAFYLAACAPDGAVIGYAAFWRAAGEGMVTNVAVAPAWRGKGVGRKLLASLMNQATRENLSSLTLEVRVSNGPAINLYESAGFIAIGIRRGYYEDNHEDAIIMLKEIEKHDL